MLRVVETRLLIKRDDTTNKTVSGLFLPDQSIEKPLHGIVIRVGNISNIKVGDTVIFNKYSGIEIEHEKETFVLLNEFDVIAKINYKLNGKIEVMDNRLLVEIEVPVEVVEIGGIKLYKPEDYQYHRNAGVYGIVKQVNPKSFKDVNFTLKVDDKIVIPQHIGAKIEIDEIEYRLIKAIDILAVVETKEVDIEIGQN